MTPRDDNYLGYPLEVTNRDVTVRDKQGRKLATVASMSAARQFLRGYRRDPSLVKAEPARLSREGDGLEKQTVVE